ncbi:MAG TPA: hypothetical protein VN903_37440 [Polyangia bacterium]|jgi:hypothetical protein|nr:hypothetical protein [Polyangia bacterium]
MKSSCFLVAIAAGVCSSCWGNPFIAISAVNGPGSIQFQFERCSRFGRTPQPYAITVTEVGTGAATEPIHCRLGLRGGSGTQPLDRWTYGTVPAHLTVTAPCASLVPGVYRIMISGSGAGQRVFTVNDDGTVSLGPGLGTCSPS